MAKTLRIVLSPSLACSLIGVLIPFANWEAIRSNPETSHGFKQKALEDLPKNVNRGELTPS
jgi:hypothetical protein